MPLYFTLAFLSFIFVDTGTASVAHVDETLTGLDEVKLVEKVDKNHTGWIWIKNDEHKNAPCLL